MLVGTRFGDGPMLSTLSAFNSVNQRLPAQLERIETIPQYEREIAYFRENIGNVKSADDMLGDYRLYTFAMTAFDLESQINSQGIMRKVMTEDIENDDSIVNRLTNSKYLVFAAAFNFAGDGAENVKDQELIDGIVDRYKKIRLEQREGVQYPGSRLALYFERNVQQVSSYFGILADGPLRDFIFTAYDLPQELAILPAGKIVEILEKRFDFEDTQTPEGRQAIIERFAASYDAQNPSQAVASPLASLIQPINAFSGPSIITIDAAAIFSLRTS
ncbi:MAG: DUF1217 domain-containing protein [Pseudomonadota bacterium]